MAHALGDRARGRCCSASSTTRRPAAFDAAGRAAASPHEPVAYITGRRAFWTIELEVGPGVLDPAAGQRDPDRGGASRISATAGPSAILDLGTGPGTLLLAALDQWPEATGLGVDASEEALAYARRNAERLGLADRAEFRPRRLGRRARRAVRPDPVQPALCRGRRRAAARRRRLGAAPTPCLPAPTASTPIAASRRSCRACSRRAASPASKSAPARQRRCRALFAARGLHDSVTQRPQTGWRGASLLTP